MGVVFRIYLRTIPKCSKLLCNLTDKLDQDI